MLFFLHFDVVFFGFFLSFLDGFIGTLGNPDWTCQWVGRGVWFSLHYFAF